MYECAYTRKWRGECIHTVRGRIQIVVLYTVKFSHHTHGKSVKNSSEKTLTTMVHKAKWEWVFVAQQHKVRSQWITEQLLEDTIRGHQGDERGEARPMKY